MSQDHDLLQDIMDLFQEGYYCAQILAILVFEDQGIESEEVIQAMSGMTGGMGFAGEACGILTGGAAVLGRLYGPTEDAMGNPRLQALVSEYVDFFRKEIADPYGGPSCAQILADEPENQWLRCGKLLAKAYEGLSNIIEAEETRL